jgi:hypothetical protein
MRKVILLTVLAGVLLVGCTETGSNSKPIEGSNDNGGASTAEEAETPTSTGEPDVRYKITVCNLDVGKSGYTLFGSVRVANTGEVPIDAEVTFSWLLGDGGKLEATPRRVKNLDGNTLVFFGEKVSREVAGSFQAHPDYFYSRNCAANAEISR